MLDGIFLTLTDSHQVLSQLLDSLCISALKCAINSELRDVIISLAKQVNIYGYIVLNRLLSLKKYRFCLVYAIVYSMQVAM